MDNLLDGLSKMFFELQLVTSTNNKSPVLVFSVGCAIIGAVAVLLDFSLYFLKGQSLLKLKHGRNTLFFLIAWSFGALVIGWLGQMTKVFVVSLSACVAVGFTWPFTFTKMLKIKAEKEIAQEPEQEIDEEE